MKGEELGMKNDASSQTTWVVGASYSGTDDQTSRFLKEVFGKMATTISFSTWCEPCSLKNALPSRRPIRASMACLSITEGARFQ